MSRKISLPLDDMLKAIVGIEKAVAAKTFAEFESDWLLQRGIERAIEIISEASRRLPAELLATRPDIAWRDIATIGNVLRHQYQSISNKIIWDVVQSDVPALKGAIEAFLKSVDE